MCNSSRPDGYNVAGSTKGKFLATPAVLAARDSQRVVPGYGFQRASAVVRRAMPPIQSEVGGDTTRSANLQRPASFLEAVNRAQTATSGVGCVGQASEFVLAISQLARENVEDHEADREVDDAIELDPTLPEEMGYEDVRVALVKFERVLQRRTRRHKNEMERVVEKQKLIDSHQAELILLQSTADATMAEMQDCKASIAELSERQATLAADRAKAEVLVAKLRLRVAESVTHTNAYRILWQGFVTLITNCRKSRSF